MSWEVFPLCVDKIYKIFHFYPLDNYRIGWFLEEAFSRIDFLEEIVFKLALILT